MADRSARRQALKPSLVLAASVIAVGCVDIGFDPLKLGLPDGVDAAVFDGIVVHEGGVFTLQDGGVPDDWSVYFGIDSSAALDLVGQSVGDACNTEQQPCRSGLVCVNATCQTAGDQPPGSWCILSAECRAGQCVQSRCEPAGAGQVGETCGSSADCDTGLRCGTVGLQAVCLPDGQGDVGDECTHVNSCGAGLSCIVDGASDRCAPTGTTDLTPGLWQGVDCESPDDNSVRAYFEVPGATGAVVGDYFRLPFPNAVATDAFGGVDLTDFPTPGNNPLVGKDPVLPYVLAVQGTHGFSASSAVQFRFSGEIDFSSLGQPGALEWVDVTDPEAPVRAALSYRFSPQRNNYMCDNGLSVRRADTEPMKAGHTYAVWFSTDVRSAHGEQISRADNLSALLADEPPSDPVLAVAHAKYQVFRRYLAAEGIQSTRVLNATVFTVANPKSTMEQLAALIALAPAPLATAWTHCDGVNISPCAQAEAGRACGTDPAFDEYHLLISLPVFQRGVPPYLEQGGNIQTSGPVRTEEVCASLTLPKDTGSGDALPLVIFTHGTGGSFRSHIESGVSSALTNVPVAGQTVHFAVLGFDQVQHGPRRGDSTESPDNLFFNFLNPDASQGNPLQGAADLLATLRFVQTLDDGAAPVRVDPTRVFVFGHSQGSMHATLALPYADGLAGAVLSGNGVSLMHGLLTKTQPVDIASLVPLLINDGIGFDAERGVLSGAVPGGTYHPVLSVIQQHIDPGDGVNFAQLLTDPAATHLTHIFQTFGLGDHFAPPQTQRIFSGVGRLAVVRAHQSAVPPYDLGPEWTAFPAQDTFVVGSESFTVAVRQYAPMVGDDGHFVAFRVPDAAEDVRQFLAQAALGMSPTVGH